MLCFCSQPGTLWRSKNKAHLSAGRRGCAAFKALAKRKEQEGLIRGEALDVIPCAQPATAVPLCPGQEMSSVL